MENAKMIDRDREHMVSLIFVNQAETGNIIQTSLSIATVVRAEACLFAYKKYLTGYARIFF